MKHFRFRPTFNAAEVPNIPSKYGTCRRANTSSRLGLPVPFRTNVAEGAYASLVGSTTALVTEPSPAYVTCEAAAAGTSFSIPAESGRLTVTKVGALHTTTQ